MSERDAAYERLLNASGHRGSDKYRSGSEGFRFTGSSGSQRFSTTPTSMAVEVTKPPAFQRFERQQTGDRHAAYEPTRELPREPVHQAVVPQQRVEPVWQPPTFSEILWDLALRVLEVAIAAAAYAIGEEIAYFFKQRRFQATTKFR